MKTITTMLSISNQTPSNAVTHLHSLTYHIVVGLHFISYIIVFIDSDISIGHRQYKFMGYCPAIIVIRIFSYTHNVLLCRITEF